MVFTATEAMAFPTALGAEKLGAARDIDHRVPDDDEVGIVSATAPADLLTPCSWSCGYQPTILCLIAHRSLPPLPCSQPWEVMEEPDAAADLGEY